MSKVNVFVLAITLVFAMTVGAAGESEESSAEGPVALAWAGLRLKSAGAALYPKPDSPIIREFNKALNVELEAVMVDTFSDEEMNLLFASGEIPNHILANQNRMLRYREEGLLRSIPIDMIKTHAPTYWQEYANGLAEGVWYQWPSYDRETETLWAIPNGGSEIKQQIVTRADWLKAVGASVPTSVEEFAEVARKFTFDDPDGNGKQDTWGMAIGTNSWTTHLQTIMAAFGYEHIERPYLDPETGQISFFEVSSGFRDFLVFMNGMWEEGTIYPDITLPKKQNVGAIWQDGKVGFCGDSWTWVLPKYRPGTWFPNLLENDPAAEIAYLGQLTAKGHSPKWEFKPPLWTYHTIGKDTTDLQLGKILELINLQMSDKFFHDLIWSGIEGEHFEYDADGVRQFLPSMSMEAQGDLGVKFFLTNIRDHKDWMFNASFGPDAKVMLQRQEDYSIVEPALGHGWVLDTQNQYRADLGRVRDEYMWKAITGKANTTTDWDTYVSQWLKAGGQNVLDEARSYK